MARRPGGPDPNMIRYMPSMPAVFRQPAQPWVRQVPFMMPQGQRNTANMWARFNPPPPPVVYRGNTTGFNNNVPPPPVVYRGNTQGGRPTPMPPQLPNGNNGYIIAGLPPFNPQPPQVAPGPGNPDFPVGLFAPPPQVNGGGGGNPDLVAGLFAPPPQVYGGGGNPNLVAGLPPFNPPPQIAPGPGFGGPGPVV